MGVSHASISVQHMSLASEEARRGHWILELELLMVVGCHVRAGN